RFGLQYEVTARFLRGAGTESEAVLWQGHYQHSTDPNEGPTYDELVGRNAEGLNRLLHQAAKHCAKSLARQLRDSPGKFAPSFAQLDEKIVQRLVEPTPTPAPPPAPTDARSCVQRCVDAIHGVKTGNRTPTAPACA